MKQIDSSEAHAADTPASPDAPQQFMVIDTGWKKRWVGLIAYVVFFVIVGGLLMWVFARFTNSWPLSALLVGGMVAYMSVMGYLASKRLGHSDDANLR